jgi:hypothetical protein
MGWGVVDPLPNQMSEGMVDIIKISPELAETLPFYKTRTQSFDAAQFLLEKVEIHRGKPMGVAWEKE